MRFAYDVVPYEGRPYARTHPGRLAALAVLYGMSPAPVDHSRVLELGCADGANLIPMALALPDSEFIGVDLAGQQVVAGQEIIAQLCLKNIELRALDLTLIDASWGKFDYIIAHGVYSWVPTAVKDAVLRIAAQNLAAQGVAFVSYNTYPGGHLRRMFREMMLHHVSGIENPAERMTQAKAVMKFLDAAIDSQNSGYHAMAHREIAEILDRPPNILFHDELSDYWEPVSFSDFMAHAQQHGLQFLAEADFCDLSENNLPQEIVDGLAELGVNNRLEREQYRDFLKFRKFRRTLLCHKEVTLDSKVKAGRLRTLYATSPAQPVDVKVEDASAGVRVFQAEGGAQMKTAHPLVIGLITRLIEARPRLIHFDELVNKFGYENAEAISEVLLSMHGAGLVEMAAWRPEFATVAGEFPVASPLARLQASRGLKMTTLAHTCVEAEDPQVRRLIMLLDGTHDRVSLKKVLLNSTSANDSAAFDTELEQKLNVAARLPLLVCSHSLSE